MWRSESDFLANRRDIWVDEIPTQLRFLRDSLTPVQYANVDNEQIQSVIAAMLEQGSAHSKVASQFPRLTWNGLGTGTTTVVMP